MATTTNYSWSTPDDTALVKDGAAAIRSLGTAIDTTTYNNSLLPIVKTIVDAKGDIIAATAADTVSRLAVGADGTTLVADSAEATGLKWAAPSAGASFTLVATTSLTAASTITVSGITSADKLLIVIQEASSANASSMFTLRVNADTASNYFSYGSRNVWGSTYSATNNVAVTYTDTSIPLAKNAANENSDASAYVYFSGGCNTTNIKPFTAAGIAYSPSGAVSGEQYTIGGHYSGSSTVSSVSIISSTGNFDQGSIRVYKSA